MISVGVLFSFIFVEVRDYTWNKKNIAHPFFMPKSQ